MTYLAHPWVLALVPLVLALLGASLLRRPSALPLPGASELAGLPPGRGPRARRGGLALRGLALLALLLALTGPRWPDQRTRLRTEGIAILVLLDVSGSMGERDFSTPAGPVARLDAAREAFRLLVAGGEAAAGLRFPGRPNDLVGLITFAAHPDCPCPLTLSHSVLLRLLDQARPLTVPGQSQTNLSDALILGLKRLQAHAASRKVMVLLSDGEHNIFDPASSLTPRQAAQLAANLGVTVHAIDAGDGDDFRDDAGDVAGNQGDEAALRRAAGRRTLHEVARITGGRAFSARSTEALLEVLHEIDTLERQPIESFRYRRFHEGYPWLALAAFALWAAALALDLTLWRRIP